MWYSVIVIVGIIAFELVGAQKETVQLPRVVIQAALPCIVETRLDPAIISQLGKPSLYDDSNTKNNQRVQKFLYCTFNKLGYGGNNGHINVEGILNLFPNNMDKQPLKILMEECNKENGDNAAETTYKIFGCFIKKSPVTVTV